MILPRLDVYLYLSPSTLPGPLTSDLPNNNAFKERLVVVFVLLLAQITVLLLMNLSLM